jgi:hypothetical protein
VIEGIVGAGTQVHDDDWPSIDPQQPRTDTASQRD